MDSRSSPFAESEVYHMDDATNPQAITKQASPIIRELRMNGKQYLDIIAPDASSDARMGKPHADGSVDPSLAPTHKESILTNL